MDKIGTYILPTTVFLIIIFGIYKKVPLFDAFLVGAKEGLCSTFSIVPSLVGLMLGIAMLRASGALDVLSAVLCHLTNRVGIPSEIIPLMLLRPFSGSGSLAIIDSIFKSCGPDSFVGRVASVMMGSTETTFYAIAVYFGAVGVKNTRHTIPSALIADFCGFCMSLITVRLLFH